MKKNFNSILKDFQNELKENDKKVKEEMNTKSRIAMNTEFVNFVTNNNCKIKDKKVGGKNDK